MPTDRTWFIAQSYVLQNTAGLSAKGVHAYVTGIEVNDEMDIVRVGVSADLSILFPSVVPKVFITETRNAKVRVFTHKRDNRALE